MRTLDFAKSAEWHAERRLGLGGSDANRIAEGDPAALTALWQEKRGEIDPEDLSMVLPVLIGSATEELNRYYYERTTGREVHSEGAVFVARSPEFMRCNLDGLTTTSAGHKAILECKHVNAFGNIEDVVQKYMAQCHHNMHCCGVNWAVLSVIQGTQKFEVFEIELDHLYLAELIDAERAFWKCVQDGTPPSPMALESPASPEAMIEVYLGESNEWGEQAATWLETKAAAAKHEAALTAIKGDKKKKITGLVPLNAKRAWGCGIQATRNKAGAITVSAFDEVQNAAE